MFIDIDAQESHEMPGTHATESNANSRVVINESEAKVAILVCAQIRKTAKRDATIVMLTPYKGQERMLAL